MFEVVANYLSLRDFALKIGRLVGPILHKYVMDWVLNNAISKICDYFESRKAEGTSGGEDGCDDLLIRKHPTESWLEAVAPKILDQLKPKDGNSLFIMAPDTLICLKNEIGASQQVDIKVRRRNGDSFEIKVRGSTVGTVEPLTSNSHPPHRGPSQTGQQAKSRKYNMNEVSKSTYIVFNTTAKSRRDSMAYVYPQRRNSIETLANSSSADDSMIVIGSDMGNSMTVASPSSVKSRTVTGSRDVSAIYICSAVRNRSVLNSADSSAILASSKH